MNKFDQLVEDLKTGKLTLTHIQMAIRAWIRDRDDISEPVRGLLSGRHEAYAGLIYKQFKVIQETIGTVDMAYNIGRGELK